MTMRGLRHSPEAKAKMRLAALRPKKAAVFAEMCHVASKRAGRKGAEVRRAKKVPIKLAGHSA